MKGLMMVLALSWPMVGGAILGLVVGLVRGHGLVGTIIDIVVGGVFGYGAWMGAMILGSRIPANLVGSVALGAPVVGGLIGVWLKGKVMG